MEKAKIVRYTSLEKKKRKKKTIKHCIRVKRCGEKTRGGGRVHCWTRRLINSAESFRVFLKEKEEEPPKLHFCAPSFSGKTFRAKKDFQKKIYHGLYQTFSHEFVVTVRRKVQSVETREKWKKKNNVTPNVFVFVSKHKFEEIKKNFEKKIKKNVFKKK